MPGGSFVVESVDKSAPKRTSSRQRDPGFAQHAPLGTAKVRSDSACRDRQPYTCRVCLGQRNRCFQGADPPTAFQLRIGTLRQTLKLKITRWRINTQILTIDPTTETSLAVARPMALPTG